MDVARIVIEICFWLCAGAVVFTYAGYPAAVWALSAMLGRSSRAPSPADQGLPSVAVLIAAHNEEAVIDARIRNALETEYPVDRFVVVVASDGSVDATAEIAGQYDERGVRVLDFSPRRGKAATLNSAMRQIDADVVVLSDANTFTDSDAIRNLARWFVDPAVGAVCGRLVLTDPVSGRNADSLYWRYETFLKKCEGRLGALLGANGAIYAIRRSLYLGIPDDTILDDFVVPLQAKLQTGCAIIYDPSAVAREETAPNVAAEFRRRSRIGAGGLQSALRLWRLLDPRRGWVSFTFASHKIARWLCPFFLIGALVTNALLLWDPLFIACMFAQIGFYFTSAAAAVLPLRSRWARPLRLTAMFTGMNMALLIGFIRWTSGLQNGVWRRTERMAESQPAGA